MPQKVLEDIFSTFATKDVFVIDRSYSKSTYTLIDLSSSNSALAKIDITSPNSMESYISDFVNSKNAKIAYGGYLEVRNLYKRSAYFNQITHPQDERNIHLGVDIWAKEGTNVLAVLDAEIHSFKNNINHGDYGPCVVLKHEIEGFVFHTLYGHLSLASIADKKIGDKVKQGEVIGTLGNLEVNGDYAPHLHFQIIIDMAVNFGDYPGVCSSNQLEFYKSNCPDPSLLLGL